MKTKGTSIVSLIVRDGELASAPDTVSITVALEPDGFLAPMSAPLVPAGSPLVLPSHAFKAGRTIPLKLRLLCGTNSVGTVAPPQIGALRREGSAVELSTLDLEGESVDDFPTFQFIGDHWQHNLQTRGLDTGIYVIRLRLADGREWEAAFVLR